MKYTGKLFGKIGRTYIPLVLTSEEVDAMERDKARLDWLADPQNKIGEVRLPNGAVMANLHCLRAAIDSAMSGNFEHDLPMVESAAGGLNVQSGPTDDNEGREK